MQWNAPSASEIAGADVMKRIAGPQVGGGFSAMILMLFVIPPIYVIW